MQVIRKSNQFESPMTQSNQLYDVFSSYDSKENMKFKSKILIRPQKNDWERFCDFQFVFQFLVDIARKSMNVILIIERTIAFQCSREITVTLLFEEHCINANQRFPVLWTLYLTFIYLQCIDMTVNFFFSCQTDRRVRGLSTHKSIKHFDKIICKSLTAY